MKKTGTALLLALILSCVLTVASGAEGPTVLIPHGEYIVGETIPEGVYTILLPAGTKIIIDAIPAKVTAFREEPAKNSFDELDAEFDKMLLEAKSYKEVIDLCDEYDSLLETLTSDNHGLDSSTELDLKIRYYKVKDLLREAPGGIIQAKDGDLDGFQKQVATLRSVMSVLLKETQAAMLENLSDQSQHYAEALEDEQVATEKHQEALDVQSELVLLILSLDSGQNEVSQ